MHMARLGYGCNHDGPGGRDNIDGLALAFRRAGGGSGDRK